MAKVYDDKYETEIECPVCREPVDITVYFTAHPDDPGDRWTPGAPGFAEVDRITLRGSETNLELPDWMEDDIENEMSRWFAEEGYARVEREVAEYWAEHRYERSIADRALDR